MKERKSSKAMDFIETNTFRFPGFEEAVISEEDAWKVVEIAKEEGILTDYLDRKAREVTNMLCAKYDYKMDIAVKQEEAREDGKQEKAIEDAVLLVKKYKVSAEDAAKDMNAPLDRVLEKLAEH